MFTSTPTLAQGKRRGEREREREQEEGIEGEGRGGDIESLLPSLGPVQAFALSCFPSLFP